MGPNAEVIDTFEFVVSDTRLVSVNNAWYLGVSYKKSKSFYITRNGDPVKPVAYQTRTKQYLIMIQRIHEAMTRSISEERLNRFRKTLTTNSSYVVHLELQLGFTDRGCSDRDASNYVKCIEDAIKTKLDIDDSRNTRVIVEKNLVEPEYDWSVIATIKLVKDDYYSRVPWSTKLKGGK